MRQLLSEHGLEISRDLIMDIVLKLQINSHSVLTTFIIDEFPSGHAMYLAASKFNHTCEVIDEYVQLYDGNRIMYEALMDFSVRDSLQLKTHYVPIDLPLHKRREALEQYCFTCECKRCLEESLESQFTILPYLEAFIAKPTTSQWKSTARNVLRKLSLLPKTNYYKMSLMKKVFVDPMGRGSIEDYVLCGISLLEGCLDSLHRLNVPLVLCYHLTRFGASAPSHELHDKFKYVLPRANTDSLY